MANLFERGPLQQDTGLLNERWAQEGSTIKNIAGTTNSSHTLQSVTSGKRLFIKQMIIINRSNTGGTMQLEDGNGGTTKISAQRSTTTGESTTYNFEVPLYFDTSIYHNEAAAGVNVYYCFVGWEESL